MIVTVTMNPCVDRLIYLNKLLPNDTNRVLKIEEDAGGKGVNVARVMQRLGCSVTATGLLGGRAGSYVETVLRREGVNTDFVQIAGDTRTNFSIQESDGSPPTTLNDKGPETSASEIDAIISKVRALSSCSSFTVLGGSIPKGVPNDIYKTLVSLIKESGAKAVLDADDDPMLEGLKAGPFLIKPNENETERLLGRAVDTLEDAAAAAQELCLKGIPVVIVSMGSKGAAVSDGKKRLIAIPPKVKAISTIGSGDSMVAGFLSVFSNGGDLAEAITVGSAAGAATAMSDGSDIGSGEVIRSLIDQVVVKQTG